MKRLFILNDKTIGGGAEVIMENIVNYLHKRYEITVMTLDNDYQSFQKIFPSDVKYEPAKIKRNHYRRINPLHYLIAIYNWIRVSHIQRRKYDIVIANKEGPCMKIVSKMKAEKKLAWVHVDYQYLYWTRGTFSAQDELKCMMQFDHVVCVSEAAANSVKKVIGDSGNLCVKYNPIDYCRILEKAESSIAVGRTQTKPLFVAVGRIVDQKNFTTLVKVCTRLCKKYDFEVWIVGDGPQRDDVEKILAQGNCDCVKILGMQGNPYQYIQKADFLISTSMGESYGLVIQEALILGVPVLSTKCSAIEECFDLNFGMLVDCDENSIERGLKYILENPDCIKTFKSNISEGYDVESLWEHRLNEIENLFS